MTKQPQVRSAEEALRLADWLLDNVQHINHAEAAAELRRLHEVNQELLEALKEIALAGMSGTGQESDEAMTEWHARQAWKFIGIAARQLSAIAKAGEQP